MEFRIFRSVLFGWTYHFLDLVVQYQHHRTAYTSPTVAQVAIEQSFDPFLGHYFVVAVQTSIVHDLASATLHHQSPSDSVQRIRNSFTAACNHLCECHSVQKRNLILIFEHHFLASIITSEIERSVNEDPRH